MQLPFSGMSGTKFEDKKSLANGLEADDIAKKNAQLAHVFRKINSEAAGGDSATTSLSLSSDDYLPTTMESLPSELANIQVDFTPASNWEIPQAIVQADILQPPPAIDIVTMNNKPTTPDLVQAAEAILGDIEILTLSSYDPSGIRGGRIELASEAGNSLENRSGLRQGGLIDIDESAFANLTGSHDPASFEQALIQQALSEQQEISGDLAQAQQKPVGQNSVANNRQSFSGPQSSGHIASSSDFDVVVEYAPSAKGEGFLFRLALAPKSGVVFKTIKHNIFFLIDRSHSIDKDRYASTKFAVIEALYLLREGDTFNVLVFDNQVVSFAPNSVPVTKSNIVAAKEFLNRQSYGGMFASTDLYASLGNIVPDAVGPQEINTAILLSDGETYLSKEKQRQCISNWTTQNAGKVALYSVAVGKGNNLPLLDLLSALNRGRLAYASASAHARQPLCEVLQTVANPIGKDIIASVLTTNKDAKIALAPSAQRLPDLYRDTPYVLYGSCSRLEDFFVFIQGRYYDRFLDIKQRISFQGANSVPLANLEREWAIQQGYDLYQKYLSDGSAASLTAARKLLSPHGIPIAFQ